MLYLKNHHRNLQNTILGPIILTVIIPIVLLDLWVEFYHHVCFPLYKILLVKRKNHVQVDRHKLKYLTFVQKIYCAYCGYANGLTNYWVKIAGETEKYWCGIQHQKNNNFIPPAHHKDFADYNNKEDFKRKYQN